MMAGLLTERKFLRSVFLQLKQVISYNVGLQKFEDIATVA